MEILNFHSNFPSFSHNSLREYLVIFRRDSEVLAVDILALEDYAVEDQGV